MRYIIGIDPDVDKSGVALLGYEGKRFMSIVSGAYDFPSLCDILQNAKNGSNMYQHEGLKVIVEAGWLNQSNWHLHRGMSIAKACKLGEAVGRNQQVGHNILEMCKAYGMDVVEARPLQKTWKGADNKITHEELAYFVPLDKKRTNQEERDAVLLAWVYAGLPVRVKTR